MVALAVEGVIADSSCWSMNSMPELLAVAMTLFLVTLFRMESVQCRRIASSLVSSASGATMKRSNSGPSSAMVVGMTLTVDGAPGVPAALPAAGGVTTRREIAIGGAVKNNFFASRGLSIVPLTNDTELISCA